MIRRCQARGFGREVISRSRQSLVKKRVMHRTATVLIGAIATLATSAIYGQQPPTSSMNAIAESYVKLVLAVGQHDPAYVDAYYGPEAWKTEAERQKKPLAQID